MSARANSRLRAWDRGVGIPLIRLFGLLPKRSRPPQILRLGFLRTAAIGDTLLLRAVIRDARAQLPESDIVLVTGEDNAEAGALVASGMARHIAIRAQAPWSAIAQLRRQAFDVLIDTGSWPRLDALLTALSGARFRVGFRTDGQSRHFACDTAVRHSAEIHEYENFRALVRAAGIESASIPTLTDVALPDAGELPAPPFVVFHPWSGGFRGHNKEWPADRWVDLGASLKALGSVVITGTAANVPAAESLAQRLRGQAVPALSLAGKHSLARLGTLLRGAVAVVSVNTGVMHLAAMVGAPTVALDGPTPPRRWGPVGPRTVSVQADLPGCGFLNLGFEYDGHRGDCMLGVSVQRVAHAVHALVARA